MMLLWMWNTFSECEVMTVVVYVYG